jgi:hypothetical protein
VVHNYEVPFLFFFLCGGDSYAPDMDDDFDFDGFDDELECEDMEQADTPKNETPDDRIPSWSVEIKYKNGTEQTTKGYDDIPDPVTELFDDFDSYFANEDSPDDELDENEI